MTCPPREALAGHANVLARARGYEAAGAFPGRPASWLQAQAYLDLLNGVPADDRIAFAATAEPPDPPDPPDEPGPDGRLTGGPADAGRPGSGSRRRRHVDPR